VRLARKSGVAKKEVELEQIGAFVWERCDGKHTCAGIAEALRKEYRITKVEAEASLLAFLETLRKRNYIGWTGDGK
jgi:hypothetical protein